MATVTQLKSDSSRSNVIPLTRNLRTHSYQIQAPALLAKYFEVLNQLLVGYEEKIHPSYVHENLAKLKRGEQPEPLPPEAYEYIELNSTSITRLNSALRGLQAMINKVMPDLKAIEMREIPVDSGNEKGPKVDPQLLAARLQHFVMMQGLSQGNPNPAKPEMTPVTPETAPGKPETAPETAKITLEDLI